MSRLKIQQVDQMFPTIPSVTPLFSEVEEKGLAKIVRYEFSNKENPFYNVRESLRTGGLFKMVDGHYTKLYVDRDLMMSDTPMERRTNKDFVNAAHGRVFIAGLGLGLIIQAILKKKEVKEVVVIEKYQDVIDLVVPKFKDSRLKVVCADIFEYKLEKAEKFDVIYFDIWPDITTDSLKEINTLHARFRNHKNTANPNCWMGSWMHKFLKDMRRKERNYY